MRDPEFFKRYFYKVSVVRQEFYKGQNLAPKCVFLYLTSRMTGIQLAHARKGVAGASATAKSQSVAVSSSENSFAHFKSFTLWSSLINCQQKPENVDTGALTLQVRHACLLACLAASYVF